MNFTLLSINEIISTFKRFTLSIVSTFITMLITIFLIEIESSLYPNLEILLHVAFVSSLGIFMFTAFRLFSDKKYICLVGIILLILYYFSLPDMLNPIDMIFQRHIFFILISFIIILWASFWKKDPSNEEFWEFTQRVIFALFISIIFTIVLYAGISGALYAIDQLFSLYIESKRYIQLWFLVVGIFGITYFLSQIPKPNDQLIKKSHTKVEIIFTKYILTPLTIMYFIILYIYTVKILVTTTFPKGILAWIIIAFSIVAIITYLSWTPFWSDKSLKYRRFFSLVLFLQTIMLGVAINMRVSEYDWTQNRYLIALLGIWLFGISLYFLLFKRAKYKWMFISLSFIITLSQIGPFSSYAVGKKSQQNRLTTILKPYKALSNQTDIKIRYEISNIVNHLYTNYGVDALIPVIPKIVKKYQNITKKQKEWFSSFVTKELGFEYVNKWDLESELNGEIPFQLYKKFTQILNVSNFDWVVDVYYEYSQYIHIQAPTTTKIVDIDTEFKLDDKKLLIIESGKVVADISLIKYFNSLLIDKSLRKIRSEEVQNNRLVFIYKDKIVSVKMLFLDIYADKNNKIKTIRIKVLYRKF